MQIIQYFNKIFFPCKEDSGGYCDLFKQENKKTIVEE